MIFLKKKGAGGGDGRTDVLGGGKAERMEICVVVSGEILTERGKRKKR
jgi:hypothetical protein